MPKLSYTFYTVILGRGREFKKKRVIKILTVKKSLESFGLKEQGPESNYGSTYYPLALFSFTVPLELSDFHLVTAQEGNKFCLNLRTESKMYRSINYFLQKE